MPAKVEIRCLNCGKSITTCPSQNQKFCCKDCYTEYQNKNTTLISFLCENCGKEIKDYRERRFCSISCRVAHKKKHEKIKRACLVCGKEMLLAPFQVSNNKLFCGIECYQKYRGCQGKTTTICKYCGIEFEIYVNQIGKRIHCSKECYNKDRNQQAYKKNLRACLQCNREFSNRSKSKFCCEACFHEYRKGKNLYPDEYYAGYYDITFMNEDTPEKAKFMGLWIGDGSSTPHGGIKYNCIDEEIINQLVVFTDYKRKIQVDENHGGHRTQYSVNFSGPIAKAIQRMGYNVGPKTGNEFIPAFVVDDLFSYFLQGVIESDGCFSIRYCKRKSGAVRKYLICTIVCANNSFLEDLQVRLQDLEIVKGGSVSKVKNKKAYVLTFGNGDSLSIGAYVYANDKFPKLLRKYYIFEKLKKVQQERDKVAQDKKDGIYLKAHDHEFSPQQRYYWKNRDYLLNKCKLNREKQLAL